MQHALRKGWQSAYNYCIMAYPIILAEAKRLKRLARPSAGELLFMQTMNRFLLYAYGFRREVRVPTRSTPFYIDFAVPEIQLAIEVDGAAYHSDIVKDQNREDYLRSQGWHVKRVSYGELRDSPMRVRMEIWDIYQKLNNPLRRKAVSVKVEHQKLIAAQRRKFKKARYHQ